VAKPMPITVTSSAVRRPCRSPSQPKKMPPNGRTTKAPPKINNVESSAVSGDWLGKNSGLIDTASTA